MLYVTKATLRDIRRVGPFLRQADHYECVVCTGKDVETILTESFNITPECMCVRLDGIPVGLFGAVPLQDGGAVIWMVGTNLLTLHWAEFIRSSIPFFNNMRHRFDYLTNAVWEKNELHIRWLEWLGAEFLPPAPHGPLGVNFRRFYVRTSLDRNRCDQHRRHGCRGISKAV